MGLFSFIKKNDQVQSKDKKEVEEKLSRVEHDMALLETQIRLFRAEQEGASR